MGTKDAFLRALAAEIELQKDYLPSRKLNTIYFGGGTPSILASDELSGIFGKLKEFFDWDSAAEITMEANPDDISLQKAKAWKALGINRLSIGIQSFDEHSLKKMNRAHNAAQAMDCIRQVREAGFENISIDLIYGLPWSNAVQWQQDLQIALGHHPQHISAYALTIEQKTAFAHQIRKGIIPNIDDDMAAEQYEIMLRMFQSAGYEQYEVSNYCLPGYYSKHNSAYWRQLPYLGLGPSAHSFDGKSRQWNVSNNIRYTRALEQNRLPADREELTHADRFNEYLLTSMRTVWGLEFHRLRQEFSIEAHWAGWAIFDQWISAGLAESIHGGIRLTPSGRLLADELTSRLIL